MGNTWDFTIHRAAGAGARADIETALAVARAFGYAPRFPWDVMLEDGWTEVSVENEPSLLTLLSERGGLVTLWNDADEDIIFSSRAGNESLAFGALRSLRPEHDSAAAKLTGELEAIFLETCTRIDAQYGFSTDEWSLEARFRGAEVVAAFMRHLESIRAGEPPYLLFWLNYFSAAYWQTLDPAAFEPHAVERTGAGVVLRTGDRPPDVEVFALR